MKISEIRISLCDEENLKGFANVTFDDCFVVRGMKVIHGPNGYFVTMPNHRRRDGSYKDIAHPTNVETRRTIEDAVLKAYTMKLKDARPEWSARPAIEPELTSREAEAWPERRRHSG